MDDSSQQIALKAFKVILVGTQFVGKSSILCRLISSQFPLSYQATVGIDYHTYTDQINNQSYCLQVWDTAGQQKFRALTSTYYKNCNGCLCVYDVTDKQSIQKCEYYLNKAVQEAIPQSCTYLIANKSDLLKNPIQGTQQSQKHDKQQNIVDGDDKQKQSKQQTKNENETLQAGKSMAQKYGCVHKLVSAKSGNGIHQMFHQLATDLVKQFSGSLGGRNLQLLPRLQIRDENQNCKC